MKFTEAQFKKSKRLNNYDQEINGILMSKTELDIEEIYALGRFKNRASLETLSYIAIHSNSLTFNDNTVGLLGLVATVTYTISGNGIAGIWLGGKSGSTTGGTVYGVPLSPSYSFNIKVNHSGGNWSFDTTKILPNDGTGKRKVANPAPKVSNKTNDIISTVLA